MDSTLGLSLLKSLSKRGLWVERVMHDERRLLFIGGGEVDHTRLWLKMDIESFSKSAIVAGKMRTKYNK